MLNLIPGKTKNLKVLCLGAHADDIEIGCGGALLKLVANQQVEKIKWVVFSANEKRAEEAHNSFRTFTQNVKEPEFNLHSFRDGFLHFDGKKVKEEFEKIKSEIEPDIVFTHYLQDRHQDHRLLSDLTWNTFRNHLILEYEIPKYDGDLSSPNVFVPLSNELLEEKMKIIIDSFASQRSKHWFDKQTFSALARLRGMESGSEYAEAFYARKIVL